MKKSLILFVFVGFLFSCKKEATIKKTPKVRYACVPQITDVEWYKKDNIAPLLSGLDAVDYPISTKDTLVQRYFNQGMTLVYGFNHAEAARSFYYATKLDPTCAMAFFGYAYVLGPNYNAGMEADNYQRAYEAIQKAKELSKNSPKKERKFINAMSLRYTKEPPEDRSQLDIDYSKAMKSLYVQYPNDTEISALYAESIMNLHPWDLYDKKGNPKEWTPEITTLLEKLLTQNPKHPGAHHFYIHAVEASSAPNRANNSAKVFDDKLVAGSGHLLHMPSHIYIRTGEYHKGTLSNIAAVEADSTYVTLCHAQGAYPLAYYPHNYHFMAATATLEGNSEWAMLGANKVSQHISTALMKEDGWGTLQHYYTIPYYVAVKFGKWQEILEMKLNTHELKYPKAIRYYAEGMAYVGKNDLNNAKIALAKLSELAKDESIKDITVWEINSVYDLVLIAEKVLKAEVLSKEKKYSESIALLKEAIEIEDALNYNEPPDWFFSVRHHLGNAQISATFYIDAIKTYEKNLKNFPKNGWAHHGLKLAYEKLNDIENIKRMEGLIAKSWKTSDIELQGSLVK